MRIVFGLVLFSIAAALHDPATAQQPAGSILGTVKNAETDSALAGANVVLEGASMGTVTDVEGRFFLGTISPGVYNLTVRYIGFQPQTQRVTVTAGSLHAAEFLLVPTTLPAQEVVVFATQARERQTPVTFSNLTRQQLMERYSVQDIPVLLAELPSITSYSENGNGIGYNYINLRGFDQRRLSVMINGVPQNDPEDHNVYWIDFPDLLASTDYIQIQRGAGSAFYGPPAIGGSVNLLTNPFTRTPGVTLEGIVGFQEFADSGTSPLLNVRKQSIAVNSGLVGGTSMLYGKLGRIQSDGYRHNSWVEMNSYFLGVMRLDREMTTRLHVFGGPIADGLAYYGLPKFVNDKPSLRRQNLASWSVDSATGRSYISAKPRRQQEIENFSQPHYELLHEWRLSPRVALHNTLFLYAGDGFFDYDASWADTAALRIGYRYGIPASGNPTNTLVRAFVGNRQWGWLPRIELDHGGGSLTAGAEIRVHRSTHWGRIQFAEGLPPNFNPDYHFYEYNGEKDIVSVYAHELYRLQENIGIMADVQVVRNRYGIANEKFLGNELTLSYVFVNPRLGLNYNIDERWNAYVSLAYTSREPRLRNLYAAEDSYFGATPQFRADTTGGRVRYDFGEPLAKPERLLDLELGGAYRGANVHLRANFYWMEFTDELVKSGQVDIFGQPVTGNAGRTRHVGIELEGLYAFTRNLTIGGNLTLSDNRLVSYAVLDAAGSRVVLDGNPIAGFPDILANVRLTYRSEHLTASAAMRHVGPFYTDNFKTDDNKNDAYTVFNLETLIRLPEALGVRAMLRGEVRNLFNSLYFMSGEGNAFFPAAERSYLVGISVHF